jgi:predicted transcriptional regulator
MSALRARVQNGRLVLDEPTELPEGMVLELAVVDAGDTLDDEERAALHAALEEGLAQAEAGEGVDAFEALKRLRAS